MFKKYQLRKFDFKLVILVVLLTVIGIYAIDSAQSSVVQKQIYGALLGGLLMIIISILDYHVLIKLYWFMYIGNIGLLLAVKFMGSSSKGAQRWLDIGGIRFQPSETAKILLILFFAQFIMKYREKLNSIPVLGACAVLVSVPLYLIVDQPDLSTTIVVCILFCIILYTGGLHYKIILTVLAVAIPTIAIVIALALQPGSDFLKDYQKDRVMAFVNPEAYAMTKAYQQLNSVTAIGSGQLDGKGYKNNDITSVKNGNFISEPQTDFIFSVIGEEFGFKGCFVVIILVMSIALECIKIARQAPDVGGAIIAAGMGGLIGFQAYVNIGVTTLLLPTTGVTLPFVSYGLTSLVSLYIGIGFVLNVALHRS